MKVSNVWRLLRIILIICRYRKIKAQAIAQELEISTRQVYRDINCLRFAGIPLYSDREGYSLASDFFMPKISLDLPEILTLIMLIDSIRAQKGTPYFNFLNTAEEKIVNLLPASLKKIIVENQDEGLVDFGLETRIDYEELEDIFNLVYKAHLDRCSINVDYFTMGTEKVTTRKVDPYALKFRFGVWYLVGYCHLRKEVRTFRVDRIKEVRMLKEQFQIPEDFNLDEFFRGSWGIIRGEKTGVKLRFRPETGKFISEMKWHSSQELVQEDDGSVMASFEVMGTQEIKRWILGFGSEVEVLEPGELREVIKEEAEGICRIY